jgi:hypothetical protein
MSIFRHGPGRSHDHGWQSDDGVIAQGGHSFQRHVSYALDAPFAVMFQHDCADEPCDRLVVGKDADDLAFVEIEARIHRLAPVMDAGRACFRAVRERLEQIG